jgi:DNA-binding transcriptional regulator YiaG
MTPTQIRQLRDRLKLTQKQLAEALLVSRETVARWESTRQPRVQPQKVYVEAMRRMAGVGR